MTKQGKTTGNLKLRSGPGMQFDPPLAYLVPDTALEILGEEGDWWKVRAAGKEGYVGKKYVAVTEAPAKADSASEAERPADVSKGRIPAAKPAPAKPIAVDARAVDPGHPHKTTPAKPAGKPAAKPNAPKVSPTSTAVRPKPKGPTPGAVKKK